MKFRIIVAACIALAFAAPCRAVLYLKQSTARTVPFGPFVDDADGKTAETGLTISQADIRISKNGAAFAQTNNAAGATHMENGVYGVPLDTTDTGTLGHLRLEVNESGALPVWQDFMVLPANTYDSLVAGSDALNADVDEVEGSDASDFLNLRSRGYKTITTVATGDNAETVIEGASAGTLIVLEPGTHTRNAEIAVPSGVDIEGAGWASTLLTGDPGTGVSVLLRVNGTNRISNLKIIATSDGACIGTTASGNAVDLQLRGVWARGDDDCVAINPAASGRHHVLVDDSVIDSTVWDGFAIVAASIDARFRDTLFTGSFYGIYSLLTGQDVSIDLKGCTFDYYVTTGAQAPVNITGVSGASLISVQACDTSFVVRGTGGAVNDHVYLDAGASGTAIFRNAGGCNIDADDVTLLNGATYVPPVTADDIAASSIGASEIAADAVGASELAADAIGSAEIAAGAIVEGTEATGWVDPSVASIVAATWDEPTAGNVTAGTFGAAVEATGDIVAGVTIPVNQTPVTASRTFNLKATRAGLVGEDRRNLSVGDEQLLAWDFAADLPTNGRLLEVESVEIIAGEEDGVTFASTDTDPGVDRTQGKVTVTAVEAGTYTVRMTVTYQDASGGGTKSGDGVLIVTE